MTRPLNILFVSPEVHPYAKTGGLADVSGALPAALGRQGHDVRIFMPLYRSVARRRHRIRPTGKEIAVPVGEDIITGRLHEASVDGELPVLLIEQDDYFDREGLYGGEQGEFEDNAQRFIFFCRAALEACRAIGFRPDIIHCNDWQTGLIPCYLKTVYHEDPFFKQTRSVFSIHNLGYQGNFHESALPAAHLPWSLFTLDGAEFYGHFSFLKAGLVYSDLLTTVSPSYCREIQTPEHGFQMDGILRHHRRKLFGILNGVDYREWNPAADPHLKAGYHARSLGGKQTCKQSLKRKLGLKGSDSLPVLGMVTRLSHQKGIDLLIESFEKIMAMDVSLAILGSGESRYENFLEAQNRNHSGRFRFTKGFNESLAHQMIAGCDLLLMPSLYEPCGLTQMYALRYGTVPVVRRVGGLADTVKPFSPSGGRGTGFLFRSMEPASLLNCLGKALKAFQEKKRWRQLMQNGMKEDFSWEQAAAGYLKRYRAALKNR